MIERPEEATPLWDLCIQHQYGKRYGGTNSVAILPDDRFVVFGQLHEGIVGVADTPEELAILLQEAKSWQTLVAENFAARLASKPKRLATRKRVNPAPIGITLDFSSLRIGTSNDS